MLTIESKVNKGTFKLTNLQKRRIEEGRNLLKKGQTISNESIQSEIDRWLSSKKI